MPRLEQRRLPLDLGRHPLAEELERVHVLELGLGAERRLAAAPDRHVGITAQRALLHVAVRDADRLKRVLEQPEEGHRLLGRAQVGLRHDLDERRAAAVEVDHGRLGARDPPARPARVHELRRILLQVRAGDPDAVAVDVEMPPGADRLVVLADLVRLRTVGIEVVLAVKLASLGDVAVQGEPDLDRLVDRAGIDRRKRAGMSEADRTCARVRLVAEPVLAPAEHLRVRVELHVDLEPDHRLPPPRVHAHARASAAAPGRGSNPNAGPTS